MTNTLSDEAFFGEEKISKILLRLAPPVMLAQLIQALYNLVDSFFVGRFAETGLTALSIIFPMQLLMIAFAVGTGVGVNTVMAARLGLGQREEARKNAALATPLAVILWLLFAVAGFLLLPVYAGFCTQTTEVLEKVVLYGRIVCVGSLGLFLESGWTKVLQARGNMKTPMVAQIAGALVNIILDPILIFGWLGLPAMGIAGAAFATVLGQFVAAAIVCPKGFVPFGQEKEELSLNLKRVKEIYRLGIPNILMQSAYTFYIFGLNVILAGFSDEAVTALGLYYKWQSLFFIPLGAMQTCIVPVISFNYAAKKLQRCRGTLRDSILFGLALMAVGTLCFQVNPRQMLGVFTADESVISIGAWGFHFVGVSFLGMVFALIFPVFFQAIGNVGKSCALTVVRTMVLFVPLGYLFSRAGLCYFWFTFPVTEALTSLLGFWFYRGFLRNPYRGEPVRR